MFLSVFKYLTQYTVEMWQYFYFKAHLFRSVHGDGEVEFWLFCVLDLNTFFSLC